MAITLINVFGKTANYTLGIGAGLMVGVAFTAAVGYVPMRALDNIVDDHVPDSVASCSVTKDGQGVPQVLKVTSHKSGETLWRSDNLRVAPNATYFIGDATYGDGDHQMTRSVEFYQDGGSAPPVWENSDEQGGTTVDRYECGIVMNEWNVAGNKVFDQTTWFNLEQ